MAQDQLVSQFVDRDKLSSDKDFLLGVFADSISAYEATLKALGNPSISLNGITDANNKAKQSTDDLAAATSRLAQAQAQAAQTQTTSTQATTQGTSATNAQSSAADQLAGKYNALKSALSANLQSQKDLGTLLQAGTISAGEYNDKVNALTTTQVGLKASLTATTAELKTQIQLQNATPNSIGAAQAQNKQLVTQRTGLDVTNDAAQIATINELIDRNNQLIQTNTDKLGQQKINIGNYTGATEGLKTILQGLGEQLQAANEQFGATADQTQRLQTGFDAVSVILQRIETGSTSAARSIAESNKALATLNELGLSSAAGVQELTTSVVKSTQSLKEFQDNLRIQENPAPTITAVSAAVKGLGGAYAIGAGVASTFADGNEKVQKSINSLLAITTILQGLEQVSQALRERGAILANIEAAATDTLAKAKELLGINTVAATTATDAAVVSTEALAVAETGAATATEAEAIGSETATVALTEQAVATDAAVVSTLALDVALSAGIIGIVAAVVIGIYELVTALGADEKAFKDAALAAKNYGDAVKDSATLSVSIADGVNESLKEQIQNEKNLLQQEQARGTSKTDQAALEAKIASDQAQYDKAESTSIADINGKISAQTDLINKNKAAQQQKQAVIDDLANKAKNGVTDVPALSTTLPDGTVLNSIATTPINDAITKAKEEIAPLQTALTSLNGGLTELQQTRDKATQSQQEAIAKNLEIQKQAAADQRAIVLDEANNEAAIEQQKNSIILSYDRSTFSQRLQAIKDNAQAQKTLAAAQESNVVNDPANRNQDGTLTEAGLQAQKDYAAKVKEINTQSNADIRAANEVEYQKNLQAALDYYTADTELAASHQLEISKDENQSLDVRSLNYSQYVQNQQQLILAQSAFELQKAGLNADQITAIKEQTKDKLIALQEQTNKGISDILVSGLDEQERQYKLDADLKTSQDELALVRKSNTTKSSTETLDAELKIINDKANQDEIAADAAKQQVIIDSNKATADAIAAARTKLKEDNIAATNAEVEAEKAAKALEAKFDQQYENNKKTLLEDEKTLTKDVTDDIIKIADAQYQNQINNIETQKTKTTDAANLAIAEEQASTDSAQVQANKIALINETAAAKQQLLTDKENVVKYKQAEFDKAVQIASATATGLESIITLTAKESEATANAALIAAEAVANPLLVPAAVAAATVPGIIGAEIGVTTAITAATIAAIAATPLPQFKGGLDHDYEGPAYTGDGGRKEALIKADGRVFITPDTPTVTQIELGDRIHPDADQYLRTIKNNALVSFMPSMPHQTDTTAILADTVGRKMDKLTKVVQNKRELHVRGTHSGVSVMFKTMNNWQGWYNQQMKF